MRALLPVILAIRHHVFHTLDATVEMIKGVFQTVERQPARGPGALDGSCPGRAGCHASNHARTDASAGWPRFLSR